MKNEIPQLGPALSLTFIAGATLLLELALIRWIPTAIYQVGFFTNFVLLSAFLGIGVGFVLVDDVKNWFVQTPIALFSLMALCTLSRVELNIRSTEEVNFGPQSQASLFDYLVLALVFVVLSWVFVCLGQGIAVAFKRFDPLKAYSYDIGGSILGILLFSLMSSLGMPAFVWFAIFSILFFLFAKPYFEKAKRNGAVFALIACVLISTNPSTWIHSTDFTWSPYQLISVFKDPKLADEFHVMANLVPHQTIYRRGDNQSTRFRQKPFEIMSGFRKRKLKRVLIVGSGSGVDVVEALVQGAEHIDAVEIDPGIAALARKFNKDKPYEDPRVNLIIDDGRGVITRADAKSYDLVIFARTDSLVRFSGSSLRLESFLFTMESFQEVKRILKPDGVFMLYNAYHSESVQNRIAMMLSKVFKRPPISRKLGQTEGIMISGSTVPNGAIVDSDDPFTKNLPSDDWPFLYLQTDRIPGYYYLGLGFTLFVSLCWFVFAKRREKDSEKKRSFSLGFFFMGVAFLLLETSSIVQFTILFGTTWMVNSVVFAGVLALVFLANLYVQKMKPSFKFLWFFYVLLFLSLISAYYIRPPDLLQLDGVWLRSIAAIVLYLGPIFLANIIFSLTLMQSEKGTQSFGWNLMGALLGGCLEYGSIILGYKNLLFIVAFSYLLVFIFTSLALRQTPNLAKK